jgi:DNA-binding transcriptional regulator YhcF (GntR family)
MTRVCQARADLGSDLGEDEQVTFPSTAWQRIVRDIADRIRSGETPVGEKIASHQELMRRHGASLGTVKRAVDYLQAADVLRGVQGAGVFVRRLPRDEDLDFEAASTGVRGSDLSTLRADLDGLRAELGQVDAVTATRLDQIEQSLTRLEESDSDLREVVGVLQAHLIELYARVGQPYPHGATTDRRKERGTTRRIAAEG